ncbi:hypothetical protein D3C84_752070 [compost metagenome]
MDLGFQGVGASVPELPKVQGGVEHAGGVDRHWLTGEADGKRLGIGPTVFQSMATGTGQRVVDRQPRFIEQLATEFDAQRILCRRRWQWLEGFVQRRGDGAQTEPEQRHQEQVVNGRRHLIIPWLIARVSLRIVHVAVNGAGFTDSRYRAKASGSTALLK